MSDEQQKLVQQLSDELRGLEDRSIQRISRVWLAGLRRTIEKVQGLLDSFAQQPEYDPETTPGAFLGSTPDGPVPITPDEKNAAAITLEGRLLRDLRRVLAEFPIPPADLERIDRELNRLYDQAQGLGENYAVALTNAGLQPALDARLTPPNEPPAPWIGYREGQRMTRLFDMRRSIVAAQRDFASLSENYREQRDATTNEHVKLSKDYYYKWWRHWGDTVSFEVATQMAGGASPRELQKRLEERIPTINDAFSNRAETIARTETLMAAGEAQDRTFRALNVGLVQYLATRDERVCEYCAPRHGCLYWIGSIKTPIHPQCRCSLSPVTLEALAIEKAIGGADWEKDAIEDAAAIEKDFREANGPDAAMRPIGGVGSSRGEADYPLMERTLLPATTRRTVLPSSDSRNASARPWPRGEPVWDPRRGWLDPFARAAYEQTTREVAEAEALS